MRALVIADKGKVGTRKQAESLCRILGMEFDQIEIENAWKGWLKTPCQMRSFVMQKTQKDLNYDVIISAGRRSVVWAIKLKLAKPVFRIHIMDPGFPYRKFFNLIITPHHDNLSGKNIVGTVGSLVNPFENIVLRDDLTRYINPQRKTVVVAIGGPTKFYKFDKQSLYAVKDNLEKAFSGKTDNILMTFSRRTDPYTRLIMREWAQDHQAYVWDESEPNPYSHFLSQADCFVVTQDSIAMISDACYTGKPVYVFRLQGAHKKFDIFTSELLRTGRMRWFDGKCESWSYEPLRELNRIQPYVLKLIGEFYTKSNF